MPLQVHLLLPLILPIGQMLRRDCYLDKLKYDISPLDRAVLHLMQDCGHKVEVGVVWEYKVIQVNGPPEHFNIVASHFNFPFRDVMFLTDCIHGNNNAVYPHEFAFYRTLVVQNAARAAPPD